ncbi:hypothetical protein HYH02_008256 [Chlamydomonas schloesseri]|uniref:F-box domain-containing protein n=1 Tax=Chlamydomonas schloesseri TaxID=2026947 RepID=A0A836B3L6_9CHLO|nr:hypothetical protein HYH02_008256 [Chlamydomonas schloesseri]|eukprot:KAG2446690.1 hypothetical protein HYH02_008256 [Chlamydomonas schloesseri]
MALVLAAVPAAIGAWVFTANLLSNDTSKVIIPRELQAIVQWLGGLRSRHRQATRRRLAGNLAPLSLEREWLFGCLPPSVTANVLGRLDPTSRKALRATCRRTRLCVSSFTQRLLLDGRGLRRFTVAPLSLHFPSVREIALAGPGSAAAPPAGKPLSCGYGSAGDFGGGSSSRGGGGAHGSSSSVSTLYSSAGGGGGAFRAGEHVVEPWQRTGPAQLLALMEGGALSSLPSLRLLDLSRWRRPGSCFSRREWKAFVDALPLPEQPTEQQHHQHQHYRVGGGGSGPGARGAALVVRLDWRVLPLHSPWPPPTTLPDWQEVAWALRWCHRRRPQVRLELEGPPLQLPGPGTLQAFRDAPCVQRLTVAVHTVTHWARHRFNCLSSLTCLRGLTLSLHDTEPLGHVLAPLQELPYLEMLSLPNSTLRDCDLAALSRLRGLRTLVVRSVVLEGGKVSVAGSAAAQAPDAAAHRQPHHEAPAAASRSAAGMLSSYEAFAENVERLVVSERLEAPQQLGLLAAFPGLAALGVRDQALKAPLSLLPRAPAAPAPAAPRAGFVQQHPQLQAGYQPPQQQQQQPQQGLLQELIQHQLGGQQQQQPQQQQLPHAVAAQMANMWAAPAPQPPPPQPHARTPLLPQLQRSAPDAGLAASVCLRELCVMFDASGRVPGRGAVSGAENVQRGLAVTDLLRQAAALPTMQRLRLWRCRSPEHVLRLLRPVAEELQVPLVLLELHDTRRSDASGSASLQQRRRHDAGGEEQGGEEQEAQEEEEAEVEGGGMDDGEQEQSDGEDAGAEEEEADDGDAVAEQEEAAAFALGGGGPVADVVSVAEAVAARQTSTAIANAAAGAGAAPSRCPAAATGASAAGAGGAATGSGPRKTEEGAAEELPEAAALLTSLLDCRAWRTPAQQLAALLLGCTRNLVITGGDSRGSDTSGLLRALVQVGSVVSSSAASTARRAPGSQPGVARGAAVTAAAARPAFGLGLGAAAVLPPRVGPLGPAGPVPRRVAVQRLVLRRQAGLDAFLVAALLRELGAAGLQVLGVAGCGGVDVRRAVGVRQAAGATGVSLAWSLE